MQQAILITFLIFGTSLALPPSISKQYRDYEYNRKTDAFYKLHIESKRGILAKETCKTEGAQLMVPSNEEDIAQLRGMLKKLPDIGDLVFVGSDGQNRESAKEAPIFDLTQSSSEDDQDDLDCEVINRRDELKTTPCYYYHPFICKLEAKDVPYDKQCDVFAKDYKYYDSVKSCYKVPAMKATWEEAYSECRAENAHLVVLNSEVERQTVKELLKTALNQTKTTYFIFAGIREEHWPMDGMKRVFRTIFSETLEAAGFSGWAPGEPNNYMDSEGCGSITLDGKYNDVPCSYLLNFLCEKEVSSRKPINTY